MVLAGLTDTPAHEESRVGPLELPAIYERWFDEVVRWALALGAPESELEDISQDVFLVVRRKLDSFDGRNLPGWLYRITAHTVSDRRRRAFFRHLWSRRSEAPFETMRDARPGPVEALEARRARALVERLLDGMSAKRRAAFVLFEIEGYSGPEIAALLEIPIKTVWTRLHHARRDLAARCLALGIDEEDL